MSISRATEEERVACTERSDERLATRKVAVVVIRRGLGIGLVKMLVKIGNENCALK